MRLNEIPEPRRCASRQPQTATQKWSCAAGHELRGERRRSDRRWGRKLVGLCLRKEVADRTSPVVGVGVRSGLDDHHIAHAIVVSRARVSAFHYLGRHAVPTAVRSMVEPRQEM